MGWEKKRARAGKAPGRGRRGRFGLVWFEGELAASPRAFPFTLNQAASHHIRSCPADDIAGLHPQLVVRVQPSVIHRVVVALGQ